MQTQTPDADFWKRKLAAFLHDPPSKCLDIARHGEQSAAAFKRAGFSDEEINFYEKHADHTAAAADRFPFPASRTSSMSCAFDGERNRFHHPLGGKDAEETPTISFEPFPTAELGIEGEGSVQPLIECPKDWDEALVWRARFFAHWRLWRKHAVEKDYRFAFLPADTRIPDHTIWAHMQIVSALASCREGNELKPAFLKFQIGPVQDFISQARSTCDLWSGSYLLSWLMAAGLLTWK